MAGGDDLPKKGTTLEPDSAEQTLVNEVETIYRKAQGKLTDEVHAKIELLVKKLFAELPRELMTQVNIQRAAINTATLFFGEVPLNKIASDTAKNILIAVENRVAVPSDAKPLENIHTGADPVEFASGQLIYHHTDLSLDGAGISFEFTRIYKSGTRYPNGPLGACWDHNYNLWLRELPGDPSVIVVGSGELREDRYTLVSPDGIEPDYYAPPEGYHAILRRDPNNGSFRLRRPDGLTYEFFDLGDVDPPASGIHRIRRIHDRFKKSNELRFTYAKDAQGRLALETVLVNDASRLVTIQYDDLGRIISVTDYSGRCRPGCGWN
jgi:YD repeat-containing protein